MKKIILEIKLSISEEVMNEIITDLKTHFNVIDDSNDYYEHIRFVTIDAELIKVYTDELGVSLISYTKPHIFVSIYRKYLYCVSVEY